MITSTETLEFHRLNYCYTKECTHYKVIALVNKEKRKNPTKHKSTLQ